MEPRDRFFVVLALTGAVYAGYAKWDVIYDTFGLAELDPSIIKAVELAKSARNFTTAQSNWQYLQSRRQMEEIEIGEDPWMAQHIDDWDYRVTVRWTEVGETIVHQFAVNTKTRIVRDEGRAEYVPAEPDQPATPR